MRQEGEEGRAEGGQQREQRTFNNNGGGERPQRQWGGNGGEQQPSQNTEQPQQGFTTGSDGGGDDADLKL